MINESGFSDSAQDSSSAIRVVGVLHHYGIRPVMQDFSIEVKSGELMVIMGPNGSGKTTLLGLMAGLLTPLEGFVEVAGLRRRSSEDAEIAIRRQVYYLPAEPWMPDYVTGREFLLAVSKLYDVSYLEGLEHADRLLQLFDLSDKGDAVIGSYSTGQRKKIAVAAALASHAKILLLDEPFSGGLDPSGLTALKKVLKGLAHGTKTTIVLSSPVPEIVDEVADRIAVLKQGKLVANDTADGLKRLAGTEGTLADAYEILVNARTSENIREYFANEGH